MPKVNREAVLTTALKAAEAVLAWYETEHERGNLEDEDVPDELRELEEEWRDAKAEVHKL